MALHVNELISIDEGELIEEFTRASGPGGQHVNKVETAVTLRFDAQNSPSLPDEVRTRLLQIAGQLATVDGAIVIRAQRFRSRERNRTNARERLADLVDRACQKPKTRIPTKVSRAAKKRRLESKKRHGLKKRSRKPVQGDD